MAQEADVCCGIKSTETTKASLVKCVLECGCLARFWKESSLSQNGLSQNSLSQNGYGEMVHVLTGDQTHKYLGRSLCGSWARRHVVEFNHRVQLAWNKFHRHRRVLVNKHVSIKLRMKFLTPS